MDKNRNVLTLFLFIGSYIKLYFSIIINNGQVKSNLSHYSMLGCSPELEKIFKYAVHHINHWVA